MTSTGALPLIPKPRRLERCAGSFAIDPTTRIFVEDAPETRAVALSLARWLRVSSIDPLAPDAPDPERGIVLRVTTRARDPSVDPPTAIDDEAYTLDVNAKRVVLRAKWAAGSFYGAQTLAQLAGVRLIGREATELPSPMPCVHIEDSPLHPIRTMHLDVARHFFDAKTVERYIDLLAFYRFNVFHFHLTDDQGFRIEIAGHPELTQIGGKDGFYTRDVASKIVTYAKERFITVVPEIDMPGHTRAILAAHPELSCTGKQQYVVPEFDVVYEDVLCAGNEKTAALVDDILTSVTQTFPSHIVHIGGDEVPKTRWKACPKCRAKMEKEKLTPEGLQGAFMKRSAATLSRLGRRSAVWDEALDPSLPKDAIVFAWRGPDRALAATRAGHDVVVVPLSTTYLNARQSNAGVPGWTIEPASAGQFTPWQRVLAFDPGKGPHIVGGGGALWTERIVKPEDIDTMAMPRLAALSEALWAGASAAERSTSEPDFIARFRQQRSALDASDVKYFIDPPTGVAGYKRVILEGKEVPFVVEPTPLFADGVVRISDHGPPPTKDDPPFSPRLVRDASLFRVATFISSGRSSPDLSQSFAVEAPRMAFQGATFAGVKYTYYEGEFHKLLGVIKPKPKRTGVLKTIALDPSFRKNDYAVIYDSFFLAPEEGVYRFKARGDDGVRVIVDRELVLVDDGEHEARDVFGEIALGKGVHQVEVDYFQGKGDAELSVSVALEGGSSLGVPVLE